MQGMFSDHKVIILELNNSKKTWKIPKYLEFKQLTSK